MILPASTPSTLRQLLRLALWKIPARAVSLAASALSPVGFATLRRLNYKSMDFLSRLPMGRHGKTPARSAEIRTTVLACSSIGMSLATDLAPLSLLLTE